MTAAIPTNEPLEARAGTTWAWTRTLTDYPASAWTLTYWLKQLATSGQKYSIAATASGDTHSVSVAATTTGTYIAGQYSWVAVATSGSEVYEVDKGTLTILPKYNADAALDDRSHARIMVAAIEALLEDRASVDQMEYTIGTRSLKRMAVQELQTWRDYYRAQVFAEDNAERRRNGYGAGRLVAKL